VHGADSLTSNAGQCSTSLGPVQYAVIVSWHVAGSCGFTMGEVQDEHYSLDEWVTLAGE
jgi:hypothetical protein